MTNMSLTFRNNKDPIPWIEEQRYIEMCLRQFSNNGDKCGIVEKVFKYYFNLSVFFNSWGKDFLQAQF